MSAIGDIPGRSYFTKAVAADGGFTLIELLVTIAIAALAAGVMFPRIEQSLSYWGFRSSVTSVEAALKSARAQAMRSGLPARFHILGSGESFVLSGGDTVMLARDIRFGAGSSATVDFFNDGSSTGGRIMLVGSGRSAVITVSPDTSLASLLQ